jgi:hypothetical protein
VLGNQHHERIRGVHNALEQIKLRLLGGQTEAGLMLKYSNLDSSFLEMSIANDGLNNCLACACDQQITLNARSQSLYTHL